MDEEQKKLIQHQGGILKIIWGSIQFSIVTMLVISTLLPGPDGNTDNSLIANALLGAGIVVAIISFLLFKFLQSDEQLKKILKSDSVNKSLNGSTSALGGSLDEHRQKALFARVNVMFFVCWSLNEAIAIFGLVSQVLAGGSTSVYGFFILALALNLLMFPKLESILERASKQIA